jgi:hypothetical protein
MILPARWVYSLNVVLAARSVGVMASKRTPFISNTFESARACLVSPPFLAAPTRQVTRIPAAMMEELLRLLALMQREASD